MPNLRDIFDRCAIRASELEDSLDVTGVDVGFPPRAECGEMTDESLKVRVHHKNQQSQLTVKFLSLTHAAEDGEIDLVVNYSRKPASESPQPKGLIIEDSGSEFTGPIQPGTSISRNGNSRHGTLGLIVRRVAPKFDGHFGLSCAHVIKYVSPGSLREVYCPAKSLNPIGLVSTLYDGRFGDAACFEFTRSPATLKYEQRITNDLVLAARFARLGEVVKKCGMCTDDTTGRVDGFGYYRLDKGEKFMLGFRVRRCPGDKNPLSAAGDSGAVWYSPDDKRGLGLATAYSTDNSENYAIASHLPCVLETLGVEIAGR